MHLNVPEAQGCRHSALWLTFHISWDSTRTQVRMQEDPATRISDIVDGKNYPGIIRSWHLIKWSVGEGTSLGAHQSFVQVHAATWPSAWTGHSAK